MTLTTTEIEQEDFYTRMDALPQHTPVTYALVAINVIVFVLMLTKGAGLLTHDGAVAVRFGSNLGRLTMAGQWWRLFTSIFVHFGLLHIALNMTALYQAGRTIERMYGSFHFLALYLFSGLCGSMISLLWNPASNSAGASGAIFGLFGGLLAFLLSPNNDIPRSLVARHGRITTVFIVLNLVGGFILPGVDNAAHIGGLLGGLVIGFALVRPINVVERRRGWTLRLVLALGAALLLLTGLFQIVLVMARALTSAAS